MAKRKMGKATAASIIAVALQCGAASPALAARDLSKVGGVKSATSITIFGASHAGDVAVLDRFRSGALDDSPSAVAAVPEPAGWVMMLFGFGLLGASMRRPHRVAAPLQS